MQNNGTLIQPPPRLQLPDLPSEQNLGARLVRRVVGLTFLFLGALTAVSVLAVSLIHIDITIDAHGTLEPSAVWPVRSQESGIITTVFVTAGDTVQAGQILTQLDPLALKSIRAQLQADYELRRLELQGLRAAHPLEKRRQQTRLAQNEATLIQARASLRERMTRYGFGSNIDSLLGAYTVGHHIGIDLGVAEVRASEAALHNTQVEDALLSLNELRFREHQTTINRLAAQIRAVDERLQRLKITAPITGVVLTEHIERQIGVFVREGDLVLNVAALDAWQVDLLVSERDIHKVRAGDTAKLKLQAFQATGEDLLYGHVRSVASDLVSVGAQTQAAPGLYRVTVSLDQEGIDRLGHNKLKRGYTVRGKIITTSGTIAELLIRYLREQVSL